MFYKKIQLQVKLIAILTVIVVAGCATAGDRSVQDSIGAGADSPTTSSTALATSSDITLPEETAALPPADSDEADPPEGASEVTDSRASMVPPETTAPPTITTAPPTTTSTTTTAAPTTVPTSIVPFSDQMITSELTANMVSLIDAATASCSEPLEFECSEAVWKVCEETEELTSGFGDDNKLSEVSTVVCGLASLAEFSELSSVLSAKYGIDYYRGYFYSFRNSNLQLPSHVDIDTTSYDGEKYRDIPTEIAEIVLPLINAVIDFYVSETYVNTPKDEETTLSILDYYNIDGEGIICGVAVASFISDNDDWQNTVQACLEDLCSYEETRIKRICITRPYFDISASDIANIELYWRMIPHVCTSSSINVPTSQNHCRRFAEYICTLAESQSLLSFSRVGIIESAVCGLASPLQYLLGNEAKRVCLSAIKEVRISTVEMFEEAENCSNSAKNCMLNSALTIHREMCATLEDVYELEVSWKNLLIICGDRTNFESDFFESRCFTAIDKVCKHDVLYSNAFDLVSTIIPPQAWDSDRERAISFGTCPISNYLFYFSIKNSEISNIVRISGPASEASIIERKYVYSNLSDSNYETIDLAAKTCAKSSAKSKIAGCASAVWNACYDLESTISEYEKFDEKYQFSEHPQSEVSKVAWYLCGVAYFAELGELIETISSRSGDNFFIDNFCTFSGRIDEEIKYGHSVLNYNPGPNGQLYLNAHSHQYLTEKAIESLEELGDSLSTFLSYYVKSASECDSKSS